MTAGNFSSGFNPSGKIIARELSLRRWPEKSPAAARPACRPGNQGPPIRVLPKATTSLFLRSITIGSPGLLAVD